MKLAEILGAWFFGSLAIVFAPIVYQILKNLFNVSRKQ